MWLWPGFAAAAEIICQIFMNLTRLFLSKILDSGKYSTSNNELYLKKGEKERE